MDTPKGRVLVMDDEMMIQLIARRMIAHLGYEVEIAVKGEEVLDLYRRGLDEGNPFQLVILDLTIPNGMDGEETMEALLKLDPEVKAVVSSGYPDVPAVTDFKDFGFCDTLLKPFDVKRLKTVLESHI